MRPTAIDASLPALVHEPEVTDHASALNDVCFVISVKRQLVIAEDSNDPGLRCTVVRQAKVSRTSARKKRYLLSCSIDNSNLVLCVFIGSINGRRCGNCLAHCYRHRGGRDAYLDLFFHLGFSAVYGIR